MKPIMRIEVAKALLQNFNKPMTSAEIHKAMPPGFKANSVQAIISMLTGSKFLTAQTSDRGRVYTLTHPEKAKDPVTAPTAAYTLWTNQEKKDLLEYIRARHIESPDAAIYNLLDEAQRTLLPKERQRPHVRSQTKAKWFIDQLAGKAEVPPKKRAAKKKAVPRVITPVVEEVGVRERREMPAQKEVTMVAVPIKELEQTTGHLIDKLLSRAGSSIKRGILDIIGSPEAKALVQSFWAGKPSAPAPEVHVTVTAPESKHEAPPPAPVVEDQPVEVRGKFNGGGPYRPPQPDRRHNPFPPKTAEQPKLKKLLIAGLLKSNHVEEVKKEFSDLFDLRFYHPDENMTLLSSRAVGADKVILLTEQVSHKHKQVLESTGVPYMMQLGSIGRLKDYLRHLSTEA